MTTPAAPQQRHATPRASREAPKRRFVCSSARVRAMKRRSRRCLHGISSRSAAGPAAGCLARARDARDTQDLVQETLLKTFKRIESFESPPRGRAAGVPAAGAHEQHSVPAAAPWPACAVQRHWISQVSDDAPSPLDQAVGSQATEGTNRRWADSDPRDREAIIARVEMGYSYERLAEALGKPSAEAARKATRRALLRLAEEMKRAE